MNANSNYEITSVSLSTNGHRELYFDVVWQGNENLDYFELRVLDASHQCVECYAYPTHNQRVIVKDFYLDLESGKVTPQTFYVELGIAEYAEDGKLKAWNRLAAYAPINANIYHKFHFFGKNELAIR